MERKNTGQLSLACTGNLHDNRQPRRLGSVLSNAIMYFASSLPQRACVLELVYVTCSKWRRGELVMLVKVASAKMICLVRVFLTQKQQREKANI